MQSMIKGLLEYAAAGEAPDQRVIVDCNAIVKQAVQDLDSAIKECSARVTWDRLPQVSANENHLLQVFSNLIGNGIKYRPSVRTPQIHLSCAEKDNEWIFCVEDNGIGLDMQNATAIFGMFKRLHTAG